MITKKLTIGYLSLAISLCLNLVAFKTHAQQLYRIVGPDGKVTFSDQPPASVDAKVTSGRGGRFNSDNPSANSTLPAEVRAAANKFPVVLYSGKNCDPCNSARGLLTGRGVPFSEKTVESSEDIEAFRKFSGTDSLPFGAIGGQQLKGFNETEWTQYLDAAGYPKISTLPSSYRNPASTPIVARSASPASSPEAQTPARPSGTPTPVRNPSNPAGIKF